MLIPSLTRSTFRSITQKHTSASRSLSTSLAIMGAQRVRVASKSDIPTGKHADFTFSGEGDDATKVLISNVDGKLYATSAKCTHYGAPLSKGILAKDGRVTCPWHGACFKVQTGDIEAAPGLDSLLSFPCEVEGDDVYVTADAEKLSGKPGVPAECKAGAQSEGKGLVIVGGGVAAINLVEAARKAGFTDSITIVSAEPYPPIDRTKLSKALISDSSAVAWRTKAHLTRVLKVNLREGVNVAGVDVGAKAVKLEDGEKIEYTSLVLATGGQPKRLPIDGNDLENVLVLRNILDTGKINAALGEKGDKDVVVIGSSFIGLEGAIAIASNKKAKSVNVVGMEAVPLENILGAEIGKAIMDTQASKNGIRFHMKAGVSRFEGESGKVTHAVIKTESGEEVSLKADVVILGVGVGPATSFLAPKSSPGFPELRKDGSIAVDKSLRVSGLPKDANVFAVGDIAATPPRSGSGDLVRIEHYNVAGNHGQYIGKLLAGGKEEPFDVIPVFWSALGGQLRYCSDGNQTKPDDVYIDGAAKDLTFAAYYAKGDTVTAVATMGKDPIMAQSSELMRLGTMPSLSEIKGGKNVLEIPV